VTGLRSAPPPVLQFEEGNTVVVAATSLVHARLIAASQGLGQASKFVEEHPIDDGVSTVYPQLSHRQRTFRGRPERNAGTATSCVEIRLARSLVSDGPTRLAPSASNRKTAVAGHSGARFNASRCRTAIECSEPDRDRSNDLARPIFHRLMRGAGLVARGRWSGAVRQDS
jgi:hypothetical protein